MRGYFIPGSTGFVAGSSGAFVSGGDFVSGGGGFSPSPLPFGPTIDLNFAQSTYFGVSGAPTTFLTTARAAPAAWAVDASGNWTSFAANTPRITNLGLLVEESRQNLFLNSQVPVTQTVTVTNGSVYTVSVYGTATLILSGAGTGTVTQGNPVTFTAGSTNLTVTVTGAGGTFQNAQVELGSFATSPIPTAGAAVTRAADLVTLTSPPAFGSTISMFASGTQILATAVNSDWLLSIGNNATNSLNLYSAPSTGAANGVCYIASTPTFATGTGAWGTGALGKAAYSFASGAQAKVFNGGGINASAATGVPAGIATAAVALGSNAGGTPWNGTISRVALWPTIALTGAQLQQITT